MEWRERGDWDGKLGMGGEAKGGGFNDMKI